MYAIRSYYGIALNDEARVSIDILVGHQYERWIREDSVARLVKEGLVGDAIIRNNFV